MTVSAPGFKTFKQEGINLEVGQSASQSVTLAIGLSEQIEVTAQATLLQTDNANIAAEISTKQVTELPLNLRNVFNFVELNSSVNNLSQRQTISSGGQQGSADQDVSFFNFGGGYFGTTAFLLDGAWDASEGWGGVIYVPSPDNVQEFKVQQNTFTAQYGWSTGNVINVVTKSGGSSFHGDVYDYLRNGALDANNYFNNLNALKRPNSHRNQFGVAIGGPVYLPGIYKQRNKTFFFFNFEGHRDHNAGQYAGTVPLPAFRNGDFSALLGPQIGTDALGRPIFSGQLYDPFSTRPLGGSFIRDPIPGNNLATYVSRTQAEHSSTALGKSSSIIIRLRCTMFCQTTGAHRGSKQIIRTSIAAALTTTLRKKHGCTDDIPTRRNTRTKKLLSSARAIPQVRVSETPITAGTLGWALARSSPPLSP